MLITRRKFLATSAAASAAALLGPSAFSRQLLDGSFEEIRRGVGTYTNSGGTIGWMIRPDGVAAVDTQFVDQARAFAAGMDTRSAGKFDLLVNTHHHRDHTAGNTVLAPLSTKTVAHANCPKWQKKQAEERGTQSEQAYADTVFEDMWSADVGDETIRLDYYGRAHTSGDSVTHFEKADVVHMGDLVFNRYPCFIDRDAGATIYGWISVLEKVHKRFSDETVFIHGHGAPEYGIAGHRDDLLHMRDFLTGLLEFARAGIEAGKTEDQVAETVRLPGFEEHYSVGWKNGVPNALRKAYQELTEG